MGRPKADVSTETKSGKNNVDTSSPSLHVSCAVDQQPACRRPVVLSLTTQLPQMEEAFRSDHHMVAFSVVQLGDKRGGARESY